MNNEANTIQQHHFEPGQRVLVDWYGHSVPLPGTFVMFTEHESAEKFKRAKVKMDNGYACHGSGFHPNCVHPLNKGDE